MISGIWITSAEYYDENNKFFKQWTWSDIKVQSIFEISEALLAIKQDHLDFVFIEEGFFEENKIKFIEISQQIKCLWVVKICNKNIDIEHEIQPFFYKNIERPLLQKDFEILLLQVLKFKSEHKIRSLLDQKNSYIIPESNELSKIPIIKIDDLRSVRKTKSGILIQFIDGLSYNYKTSYNTFFKLTRTYSNIFEIVPDLLVNLENL